MDTDFSKPLKRLFSFIPKLFSSIFDKAKAKIEDSEQSLHRKVDKIEGLFHIF